MGEVLKISAVYKSYTSGGGGTVQVLNGADLTLDAGKSAGFVAPSGAGKSTLLHIAGLLDKPDRGSIVIAGRDMEKASTSAKTKARLNKIGFVYQFHHLLAEFTALENIMLPQLAAGARRSDAAARGLSLLARVGLEARATHRPSALSGGECQRVAICRALANQPSLLIADEPTGNLDPVSAAHVFDVLLEISAQEGLAALVATHNLELAKRLDHVFTLKHGKLETL